MKEIYIEYNEHPDSKDALQLVFDKDGNNVSFPDLHGKVIMGHVYRNGRLHLLIGDLPK